MTESKYQNKIIKKLEAEGYYVLKLLRTNKNGIPDILALKATEVNQAFEDKIREGLLARGFKDETILNNRGLIGAAIEETVKASVDPLFIEVKGAKGKVAPLQQFRINELNKLNFKAIVSYAPESN